MLGDTVSFAGIRSTDIDKDPKWVPGDAEIVVKHRPAFMVYSFHDQKMKMQYACPTDPVRRSKERCPDYIKFNFHEVATLTRGNYDAFMKAVDQKYPHLLRIPFRTVYQSALDFDVWLDDKSEYQLYYLKKDHIIEFFYDQGWWDGPIGQKIQIVSSDDQWKTVQTYLESMNRYVGSRDRFRVSNSYMQNARLILRKDVYNG